MKGPHIMTGYFVFKIGMGIVFLSIMLVFLFGKGDQGISRRFWSLALIGCFFGIIGSIMMILKTY